jgi:hypothetical protein
MKLKLFSGLLTLGLVFLPTAALADGDERNEPEHSITEAHEGLDGGELLAAGSGLVIALGLAFMIGRRSRKKD